MRRPVAAGIAALTLLVMQEAAPQQQSTTYAELDTILVTGEQPGPPLWKVWKGDHVLWILPLVDMYPRRMEWDSSRVGKLIAESQEYIARPRVTSGISVSNPLSMFRALDLVTTSMQLPKGKTLAKVLPPELYQRFKALKSRYFPRNHKIDTQTVSVATGTLRDEILEHENLEMFHNNSQFSPTPIMEEFQKSVRANKSIRQVWPTAGTTRHMTGKEFKVAARAMEETFKSPAFASWAIACMEQVIAWFEDDLESVKRRANAWARGQIAELVNPAPLYPTQGVCRNGSMLSGEGPQIQKLRKEYPSLYADLTPDVEGLMKQARQLWLAAAEKALERNTTTFSMLRVDDILDKDGLVEQLRAKGFTVEISAE